MSGLLSDPTAVKGVSTAGGSPVAGGIMAKLSSMKTADKVALAGAISDGVKSSQQASAPSNIIAQSGVTNSAMPTPAIEAPQQVATQPLGDDQFTFMRSLMQQGAV